MQRLQPTNTFLNKYYNIPGSFVILDGKTWKLKGTWGNTDVEYGYDFWYQYKFNCLISTEWGNPQKWWYGLDVSTVQQGWYTSRIEMSLKRSTAKSVLPLKSLSCTLWEPIRSISVNLSDWIG